MNCIKYKKLFNIIVFIFTISICGSKVQAAEKIAFINGAIKRSITVESLEKLAKTGKAEGLLEDALKISKQKPLKVSKLLNQEFKLPLVITTRLMYSTIGEVMIGRIAKIIHPIRVPEPSVSIPAIRSAVIDGLIKGNGSINIVQFVKMNLYYFLYF